jgi:hypothetical protein
VKKKGQKYRATVSLGDFSPKTNLVIFSGILKSSLKRAFSVNYYKNMKLFLLGRLFSPYRFFSRKRARERHG